MSTHKHIDRICAVVIVLTLLLTVLFMNGASLGLQTVIDEDAEGHSDSVYFTANDQDGDWDSLLHRQRSGRGLGQLQCHCHHAEWR